MDWRYVRLDPEKLHFLRLKKSWNLDQICAMAATKGRDPVTGNPVALDKRTVRAIFNGEKTFVSTARVLAHLLDAENILSVLHPDDMRELHPPSSWQNPLEFFRSVGEWDVVEPIENEQQTSNGLRYDVWRVRHRHVENRLGRAKCYDLSQLSTNERTRLKAHLTRHSEVSDRVGHHPNIAKNLSAAEWDYGALWWVMDEWVEGDSLATLLAKKTVSPPMIPGVMRQIAEGLRALHQVNIVRRELSPRFVIVRRDDSNAVLTDFELSKLLEGAPTVSPKKGWPDDPYRAIEVEGDSPIDVRADVYSWGRILVRLACEEIPAKGTEALAIAKAELPPAIRRLALSCVAPARSDRPNTMNEVLTAMKKWN